ncbi:MAG: hypothetical protein ACI87W_000274 [Halieaceae bacterium]|jgi:hypothetical protein
MKVTLQALRRQHVERLIIESVDLSLYIAHALVDGQRLLISEADGSLLKTRSLLDMKKKLSCVQSAELVLTQRSPFDEMIGHSFPPVDNSLEVTLGPGYEALPPWQQ